MTSVHNEPRSGAIGAESVARDIGGMGPRSARSAVERSITYLALGTRSPLRESRHEFGTGADDCVSSL